MISIKKYHKHKVRWRKIFLWIGLVCIASIFTFVVPLVLCLEVMKGSLNSPMYSLPACFLTDKWYKNKRTQSLKSDSVCTIKAAPFPLHHLFHIYPCSDLHQFHKHLSFIIFTVFETAFTGFACKGSFHIPFLQPLRSIQDINEPKAFLRGNPICSSRLDICSYN